MNQKIKKREDFIDRGLASLKEEGTVLFTEAKEWKDFKAVCNERFVYIYGLGTGADYLFRSGEEIIGISGFIDSNRFYLGKAAEARFPELLGTKIGLTRISSPTILDELDPELSVFLITTTKYLQELSMQLYERGFRHVFSLMEMEGKLRANGIERKIDTVPLVCIDEAIIDRKVEKKKIVFQSTGKYCEHGKYITEALLKIRQDLDIIWMVDDNNTEVPKGVRISNIADEWSYRYELETAHIWVAATQLRTTRINKREGQLYVQTKHWGSVTLKRFYLDSNTLMAFSSNVDSWRKDFSRIDYMITGSDFDTDSCRRGFGFTNYVLQIGSPRTDVMFRVEQNRQIIRNKFNVGKSNKILLYAPTYRYVKCGNNIEEKQNIRDLELNYNDVKHALEDKFGGSWVIMLRNHPGVAHISSMVKRPDFVLDVSSYPDGMELCAACDAVITDYSSIMFEPAQVKIPVFLFAPDIDEYIDKEYDFLIDYFKLPFSVAVSNDELIYNIHKHNNEKYNDDIKRFFSLYGVSEDGHASERAALAISRMIDEVALS